MTKQHEKLKILIADDHPLMRDAMAGICISFNKNSDILHARSYDETLSSLKSHSDIDLLLLDLNMPPNNGLNNLETIRNTNPTLPIIVMSATDDRKTVKKTFDLGVRGYVHKSASHETVVSAIKFVLTGNIYVPPEILGLHEATPTSEFTCSSEPDNNQLKSLTLLTKRQREVIDLLIYGMSNKEIGRELGLTEGTVRAHLGAIFKTLNIKNRIQAGILASKAHVQTSDSY